MNRTYMAIEEVKADVYGAIWVSNGDPALVETGALVDEVGSAIWSALEFGAGELLEVKDAHEFREARRLLRLSDNPVRRIYKWDEDYVTNYIAFPEDWDYIWASETANGDNYKASVRSLGMTIGKTFGTFAEAKLYIAHNVGAHDVAEILCCETGERWSYEGGSVGSNSGAEIVNHGCFYSEQEWGER